MSAPHPKWEMIGSVLNDNQYIEIIERMAVPGGWIYKATYQYWGCEPRFTPPAWAVFVPDEKVEYTTLTVEELKKQYGG